MLKSCIDQGQMKPLSYPLSDLEEGQLSESGFEMEILKKPFATRCLESKPLLLPPPYLGVRLLMAVDTSPGQSPDIPTLHETWIPNTPAPSLSPSPLIDERNIQINPERLGSTNGCRECNAKKRGTTNRGLVGGNSLEELIQNPDLLLLWAVLRAVLRGVICF